MKEKKRKEIIESSIRLFAVNGFQMTSVQDIVDDCGMSKGAFYNYFSSKEALHVAIFEYYFEEMQNKFRDIGKEDLTAREKLKKQLNVPFDQLADQKAFFVMYLREQIYSINKELHGSMQKVQAEMLVWYKVGLKEIYGDKIAPYLADLIITIEGIRNSYLTMTLFSEAKVNLTRLPDFLMKRIDELVQSFENGEVPIMNQVELTEVFKNISLDDGDKVRKVFEILDDMEAQLNLMELMPKVKVGLEGVIAYLKKELKEQDFNEYMVQGMLANLKEVKVFDTYRNKIAELLNIQAL